MLINQKECKRLAVALGQRRAWKLTRVSKEFLVDIDVKLRYMIQKHIDGLPSVGRTIYALAFLILVSGTAHAATASWYDSASVKREGTCHAEKCYTASGKEIHELERSKQDFVASNDFPLGTRVRVCGKRNCVDAVVLDRGGFKKHGRQIDLAKQTFAKIASLRQGVAEVTITPLNSTPINSRRIP